MAFFPPIPLIRKNHIIKKLTESNAFSEETAKTFSGAGIINPNGFNKINDKGLMINHENCRARPTYFAIKDKDILWFIPISSKVDKYQVIINKKLKNMVVVDQL